jgi:hypothetical protein
MCQTQQLCGKCVLDEFLWEALLGYVSLSLNSQIEMGKYVFSTTASTTTPKFTQLVNLLVK